MKDITDFNSWEEFAEYLGIEDKISDENSYLRGIYDYSSHLIFKLKERGLGNNNEMTKIIKEILYN